MVISHIMYKQALHVSFTVHLPDDHVLGVLRRDDHVLLLVLGPPLLHQHHPDGQDEGEAHTAVHGDKAHHLGPRPGTQLAGQCHHLEGEQAHRAEEQGGDQEEDTRVNGNVVFKQGAQ